MGIIPTLNTFVAGTPIVASAMNSNFDAIVAVVNGGIDDSNVSQISASKVTSGEFHPDRIPRLSEDKLPRAAQGFLKAKGASADPAYELVQWGDVQAKPAQATRWPTWSEVSDRPSTFPPTGHTHNAGDINSGTFAAARIPNLDAGKITSGVFGAPRLSALFGSGGTAGTDRVNIDATRINSGTLNAARIPNLDASKITSGRLDLARLPTSGTANRFLKVGTANSTPAYSTVTWNDVQSKPSTFPPSAHSHTRGDLPVGANNATQVAPGQAMTGSGNAQHPVGSVRLLVHTSESTSISAGDTVSGSLLRLAHSRTVTQVISDSSLPLSSFAQSSQSVPGTWQALSSAASMPSSAAEGQRNPFLAVRTS